MAGRRRRARRRFEDLSGGRERRHRLVAARSAGSDLAARPGPRGPLVSFARVGGPGRRRRLPDACDPAKRGVREARPGDRVRACPRALRPGQHRLRRRASGAHGDARGGGLRPLHAAGPLRAATRRLRARVRRARPTPLRAGAAQARARCVEGDAADARSRRAAATVRRERDDRHRRRASPRLRGARHADRLRAHHPPPLHARPDGQEGGLLSRRLFRPPSGRGRTARRLRGGVLRAARGRRARLDRSGIVPGDRARSSASARPPGCSRRAPASTRPRSSWTATRSAGARTVRHTERLSPPSHPIDARFWLCKAKTRPRLEAHQPGWKGHAPLLGPTLGGRECG